MENEKWYLKTSVLVIALLSVGPFALPLLWFNPRYRPLTKVLWTVLVLILSYALGKVLDSSIKAILEYYRLAFSSE